MTCDPAECTRSQQRLEPRPGNAQGSRGSHSRHQFAPGLSGACANKRYRYEKSAISAQDATFWLGITEAVAKPLCDLVIWFGEA